MANIKDRILADAQSRKSEYGDRMEVAGPQSEGLPAGLSLYSIRIAQLFDYMPINYITVEDEFFTSLQKGDFERLLAHLRLIEEETLSAADFTTLFLLLENPSRYQFLVEKAEDFAFPESADEGQKRLLSTISSPQMQKVG